MKIIKKSTMADGTNIQIEDWKDNKNFRLELTRFESNEQVEKVFKQLEDGSISLNDLSEHFLDVHRDMYYLGMTDIEEIQEEQDEESI